MTAFLHMTADQVTIILLLHTPSVNWSFFLFTTAFNLCKLKRTHVLTVTLYSKIKIAPAINGYTGIIGHTIKR
jgi:hypothetical protein